MYITKTNSMYEELNHKSKEAYSASAQAWGSSQTQRSLNKEKDTIQPYYIAKCLYHNMPFYLLQRKRYLSKCHLPKWPYFWKKYFQEFLGTGSQVT